MKLLSLVLFLLVIASFSLAFSVTYDPTYNQVHVIGGSSTSPVTFADIYNADKSGNATLFYANVTDGDKYDVPSSLVLFNGKMDNNTTTLTTQVRPEQVGFEATKLTVSISGLSGSGTLTINGTDRYGTSVEDSISVSSAGSYSTVYWYKNVTNFTADGFSATVEITQPADLQMRPTDEKAIKLDFNVSNLSGSGNITIWGYDKDSNLISENLTVSSNSTFTTVNRYSSLVNFTISGFNATLKIVQNQWGVVWGSYGDMYYINANLHIGDGSTLTYLKSDYGEHLQVGTSSSNAYSICLYTNATFQLGDKDSDGYGVKGSSLNWYAAYNKISDGMGTYNYWKGNFKLYGSTVNRYSITSGFVTTAFSGGSVDIRDSEMFSNEQWFFTDQFPETGNVVRSMIESGNGLLYIYTSGVNWDKVKLPASMYKIIAGKPTTITNTDLIGIKISPIYNSATNLTDCPFIADSSYVVPQSNGGYLHVHYHAAIRVINRDNYPVQGARVRIWNSKGSLVFDGLTDSNGQVDPLLETYYVHTNSTAIVDEEKYNPFTVRIDYLSYPSREFTTNITAPVNWTISMGDKPQDIGAVKVYGTEYAPGDSATIYAQVLNGDGTPANNATCNVTLFNRTSSIFVNETMTHIPNSDGGYYYNFTLPTNISVLMADVHCENPTAYGSAELHIAGWASNVNTILDKIDSKIIPELDNVNSTVHNNYNLLVNINSTTSDTLAKWGNLTAQQLYDLENSTNQIASYINTTRWGTHTFQDIMDKWGTYTADTLYTVSNQTKQVATYINTTRWGTYLASDLYNISNYTYNLAYYINYTRWNNYTSADLMNISEHIKSVADSLDKRVYSFLSSDSYIQSENMIYSDSSHTLRVDYTFTNVTFPSSISGKVPLTLCYNLYGNSSSYEYCTTVLLSNSENTSRSVYIKIGAPEGIYSVYRYAYLGSRSSPTKVSFKYLGDISVSATSTPSPSPSGGTGTPGYSGGYIPPQQPTQANVTNLTYTSKVFSYYTLPLFANSVKVDVPLEVPFYITRNDITSLTSPDISITKELGKVTHKGNYSYVHVIFYMTGKPLNTSVSLYTTKRKLDYTVKLEPKTTTITGLITQNQKRISLVIIILLAVFILMKALKGKHKINFSRIYKRK